MHVVTVVVVVDVTAAVAAAFLVNACLLSPTENMAHTHSACMH